MAQPAPAPAAPAAKPAKSKGRGKLFIMIAAAVLLLGGGGGAFWWMRRPAPDAAAAAAAVEHEKPEHTAPGGIVSFEPFVVNLADAGGSRFLRISVRVLVEEEAEAKEIQESEVTLMRIRAEIIEILTRQTSDVISTPEGKTELKKAILERASAILEPLKPADVLFSDFVVQF